MVRFTSSKLKDQNVPVQEVAICLLCIALEIFVCHVLFVSRIIKSHLSTFLHNVCCRLPTRLADFSSISVLEILHCVSEKNNPFNFLT